MAARTRPLISAARSPINCSLSPSSHLLLQMIATIVGQTDVLTLTAEQVRTRYQLGQPPAQFQAMSQQIADICITSRVLHSITLSANWALAQEDDSAAHRERVDTDLDVLAYWVASALPEAMQKCYRINSDIGTEIAYPLHRYYSQVEDIARMLGGTSFRLDCLGARCPSAQLQYQ
ncbi:acyl-CoA dehydrogenase family protein [Nocardia sp. NBC_01009]|uniref:acyl-CoA dehydrogenase family protein n=1 Tax=Nocardia sp. NBC_01009 TaxID=2975996 RepID=UPI00386D806B|nr:acyl-CoA dehydrogenase family protein [Nocardia sp. NBC_01009]